MRRAFYATPTLHGRCCWNRLGDGVDGAVLLDFNAACDHAPVAVAGIHALVAKLALCGGMLRILLVDAVRD